MIHCKISFFPELTRRGVPNLLLIAWKARYSYSPGEAIICKKGTVFDCRCCEKKFQYFYLRSKEDKTFLPLCYLIVWLVKMKKRISQKELKILWKQLRKGEQKGRVIMVIDCSISLIIQSSNYEIYSERPSEIVG